MSPVSRRSLAAVILVAAVLTVALAVPLQAAVFQSPPPPATKAGPAARPPQTPSAKFGPATCSGSFYTIVPGDTLNSIARRNGVSVNDLMRCNGLTKTTIYAGKRLLIPGKSASAPAASQAAQPVQAPVQAQAPAAVKGACYYTVRSGDTLSSIAASYGTTAWYLQSINYIPNPSMVYAGKALRVPCGVKPAPEAQSGSGAASTQGWYQVRAGDTVSKIAVRLGVSSADIIAANGLTDPYTIYEGQWLRVP